MDAREQFVEEALHVAETGEAGHWADTSEATHWRAVAGILADEVRRLRRAVRRVHLALGDEDE